MSNWCLRVLIDPFSGQEARCDVHEGQTVGAALGELGLADFASKVHHEKSVLPFDEVGDLVPDAGDVVFVEVEPGDPASIAAAFTAAKTLLTATTISGVIARIVVGFALQWVAQSLFAPRGDSFDNEAAPNRYSVTGARNRLDPFGAIPFIAGRHRFTPPYGAAPYTESTGVDQYLRILVVWGYGPVQLDDLRIGNTPISSFSDVQVQHDLTGGATLGLFPKVAEQENLSVELSNATQPIRSTADDVDEIGVTITFPRGIYNSTSSRGYTLHFVGIVVEYRLEGSTNWLPWVNEVYSGADPGARRFSHRRTVPRGRYEVRVSRSGVEGNERLVGLAQWTSIRSFTNEAPVTKPGVAKSVIRIRATDQLNGVIDEVNAIVSRLIPTWNGSAWVGASVSENPAAIFRNILKTAANAKSLPDSRIDSANLGDWYEHCEAQGYVYSKVISPRMPLMDLLKEVAAAGFASPRQKDGKWGVVIDRPRTVVKQHFTPRNVQDFSGEVTFLRQPHALRVQFLNKDQDYQEDERLVYSAGRGASNSTKFETLSVPGVVTPAAAYRQGQFALASATLRPESWTVVVDFEYLIAERGDLVRFSHDSAAVGIGAARIKGIDGSAVTLDEPLVIEAGKSYSVEVRDNTAAERIAVVTTTAPGTYDTVTLSTTTGMQVGNLLAFGEADSVSVLAVVQEITPRDDLSAELRLIPYQDGVYETGAVPAYETVVSDPVAATYAGPASPQILGVVSDETALPIGATGISRPMLAIDLAPGVAPPSNARVTPAVSMRVRFREVGRDQWSVATLDAPAGQVRAFVDGAGGAVYEIEAQAQDGFGGVSAWTRAPNHTLIGLSAAPSAVDTFRLRSATEGTTAEWAYEAPGDLARFEIRHSPNKAITEWSRMLPVATQISPTARAYELPAIGGAFAIKPVDALGNYADTALFATRDDVRLETVNVVQEYDEAPTFSGTKTQLEVYNDKLILSRSLAIQDLGPISDDWAIGGGYGGPGVYSSGTYEFGETDLGAIYSSRVTVSADVLVTDTRSTIESLGTIASNWTIGSVGLPEVYAVRVEASSSDVASPGSGDWSDWVSITSENITARHLRFRATMQTDDGFIQPEITGLTATIDMPDRRVSDGDVSVAGTKSVTFDRPFRVVKAVSITPQDLATGDTLQVTAKSATGFTVQAQDSGGASVTRTFDYIATGYGEDLT